MRSDSRKTEPGHTPQTMRASPDSPGLGRTDRWACTSAVQGIRHGATVSACDRCEQPVEQLLQSRREIALATQDEGECPFCQWIVDGPGQ